MLNELLPYYERELLALRRLSKEFAARYPKVAGRLLLEGDVCEDPHVERLLEGFALLTARIHRKLDDEFPQISDAMLGVLYPHYLRPIPSTTVVQLQIDPAETRFTSRQVVARHTTLLSRPVKDMPCKFRTCYPVELWPLDVVGAGFEQFERSPFKGHQAAVAVIQLRLRCRSGLSFADLGVDRLRFFLDGEGATTHSLYELLFNNLDRVVLRDPAKGAKSERVLSADRLAPVGFGRDEGLLDYDPRSFLGYRLLHEYFTLPDKFLFFELHGLEKTVGYGRELEIVFFLNEFERRERIPYLLQAVNDQTFRLGVTPAVNLFKQMAEPIEFTQHKSEYQVIPDVRRPWGMEVYSVDSVERVKQAPGGDHDATLQPFFSFKHGRQRGHRQAFWSESRRPAPRHDDPGSEVYLALADPDADPAVGGGETLVVSTTCTNRDLPGLLPFGGQQGDFSIEGGALISRIRCLRKPTATLRPPLRRAAHWRLISHLSLNHLSIVDGGRDALVEILGLYNFSDNLATRNQISAITGVSSRPCVAPLGPAQRAAVCRGTEVLLEFDEEQFAGSGVYLFASVLERFLALYASLNSFTRLTVHSKQREGALARWPPRAGEAPLV